ncbi:hypothetical protein AKJ51_05265 [candidate division MSBL1 archaeon SCGC-AAA382A20]|uniref:Proteasome assembly chaperone family protein n=1 Tax=candidate division MSBL1 archaeon SCGC-AAA382A20 TaxID=1698280 RepID=A0A133VFI7_9EURY|nr:hypothetical protein AKJ51_05265 [candidate division MSBL1 archaeon SCGC-AAA382A20]
MGNFRIGKFKIDYKIDKSELKNKIENPTFVEGLLGVGQVGLIASDHLLEEMNFEKVANVYSSHFSEPFQSENTPGVVYSEDGTAKLNSNGIFYDSSEDIFLYKGYYQGDTCEFYYLHANRMIDFCCDFKVEELYTLGGLGVGEEKEEPQTKAVITKKSQEDYVSPHAEVLRGKENRPGVTGLSGLLIGLADKNNKQGICLLGETHGAYPDPKAAKSVLASLSALINLKIDLSGLDDVAEEIKKKREKFKRRMQSLKRRGKEESGDKRYIG